MDDAAQRPESSATTFESAFARLQVEIETACAGQPGWPRGVAAGIRAALEFAAAEPAAARALTTEALADGRPGFTRYSRLIAYLCDLLAPGRTEHPDSERLPDEIERALAGGLTMLVAQRLDTAEHAELPALAPEATQFALTPYLGVDEARRIATAVNL
jgi:hypothetical protein